MKRIFVFALVIIASLLNGGCNEIEFTSSWRTDEIKIDGDISDWGNNLTAFKDHRIFVGIMNDESSLYIALSTLDRMRAMQMLTNGFTVRFRPENSKYEFGINFPFGLKIEGGEPGEYMNGEMRGRQAGDFNFEKIISRENEFFIVNKDDYPLSAYPLINNIGIEIKISAAGGRFNYEVKVPLKTLSKQTYYIETSPGETLEIGFETKNREFEGPGGDRTGGRAGGAGVGMPGSGRSGGGRSGRSGASFRGAGGLQMLEQLDIRTQVKLSVK